MSTKRAKYFRCAENAIAMFRVRDLALYYRLKARCSNSVVYGGWDNESERRLGVKRRTHFNHLKRLVRVGLAEKDASGNYRLLPFAELSKLAYDGKLARHRCTVVVEPRMDVQDIVDQLRLKLFEERHRQTRFAENRTQRKTRINGQAELRGDPAARLRSRTVKFRGSGYEAMPGDATAAHMGISRSTLQRWKVRETPRSFKQVDRRRRLTRAESTRSHLCELEAIQDTYRCTIYKSGDGWIAALPSMYRLRRNYSKPVRCKK